MNPGKSALAPGKMVPRLFLGLTGRQWSLLLFLSFFAVILLSPWLYAGRFWPGAGLFFTILVLLHLCLVAGRYVAFPGLISFAACIQWIVAPWLTEFYPSPFSQYLMAIPVDEYLKYALPATVVFWLGLHWPLRWVSRQKSNPLAIPQMPTGWCRVMDGLIVGGLFLDELGYRVPGKYAFIIFILASFRFFAALSWMITRSPGWRVRVAIVLIYLFLRATEQTLFYHLIHWGGYFLLSYSFVRGWRWKLGISLIAAIFILGFFQLVKSEYRKEIETYETLGEFDRLNRLWSLSRESIMELQSQELQPAIGSTLVRFNQGWIIARIMDRVPEIVPYARGETLYQAAIYSIILRAIVPTKPEGASQDLFGTFTGIVLRPGTSMGLSVIGELYANFGLKGGIAATFIYASFIGFLFSWFLRMSAKSPFWLAITPLILLPAVDPGWNIEDVMNQIVKVSLVVAFLLFWVPQFRRLLGLQRPASSKGLPLPKIFSQKKPQLPSKRALLESSREGALRSSGKRG